MRKVVPKPIREYFFKRDDRSHSEVYFPILYRYSRSLNPVSIISAACVVFFIGGFFNTFSLALFIGTPIFMAINYFHLLKMAESLEVKRKITKFSYIEMQTVEIELSIKNKSRSRSFGLTVMDHFTASSDENIQFSVEDGLPPASRRSLRCSRICDAGAGAKKMGPLIVRLRDPLGFFEVDIIDDEELDIEVYPKIEEVGDVQVTGSRNGLSYGNQERPTSGSSISFKGIREYARGDSLRHISWKVSAKRGQLFIKEFDLMTNAKVYVALNLDSGLHLGMKAISTWEVSHDIAIAILKQQMVAGNQVEFLTNNPKHNMGLDMYAFEVMAKKLVELRPEGRFDHEDFSFNDHFFLNDHLGQIETGSTLFYIAPYADRNQHATLDCLNKYRAHSVHVHCIYLDIHSFYKRLADKMDPKLQIYRPPTKNLAAAVHDLSCKGIDTHIVKADQKLTALFHKTAKTAA